MKTKASPFTISTCVLTLLLILLACNQSPPISPLQSNQENALPDLPQASPLAHPSDKRPWSKTFASEGFKTKAACSSPIQTMVIGTDLTWTGNPELVTAYLSQTIPGTLPIWTSLTGPDHEFGPGRADCGDCYKSFAKSFVLPDNVEVTQASLEMRADDRASAKLNGLPISTSVSPSLFRSGTNTIEVTGYNNAIVWEYKIYNFAYVSAKLTLSYCEVATGTGDRICSNSTNPITGATTESCFECPAGQQIIFKDGKPSSCSALVSTQTQQADFGIQRVYDQEKPIETRVCNAQNVCTTTVTCTGGANP